MSSTTTPRLLAPGEIVQLFRVETKTVARSAEASKLPSVRTLGGHRRFLDDTIQADLTAGHTPRD